MREILVPEALVVLFLAAALAWPVAARRPVNGAAWLPLLALLIALGLFPAYGFRPETLPLTAFAALAAFLHIPALFHPARLFVLDLSASRAALTVLAVLALAGCAAFAVRFAPADVPPARETRTLTLTLPAEGEGNGGGELFARVYAQEEAGAPLLALIPPASGSVWAVELVCAALAERGFAVVTWSRPGFDSPAVDGEGGRYGVSPAETVRRVSLARSGNRTARANAAGRAMEAERREELAFVLAQVRDDAGALAGALGAASRDAVFLAGWEEGGGAAALFAGDEDLVRAHGIRGVVLVESPLWSSYRAEERTPRTVPADALWLTKALAAAADWFQSLPSARVSGGELPALGCPALALVSDRAFGSWADSGKDRFRREPLRLLLRASGQPAVLAAIESAGPRDYTDYPVKYPLLTAISPGAAKPRLESRAYIEDTASLIARFAARLLEPTPGAQVPPPETAPLKPAPLSGSVLTETWNWPLPAFGK
ncbi:MAG: hypothetical protein MdMp014T_2311 [Treponematales bacterium]